MLLCKQAYRYDTRFFIALGMSVNSAYEQLGLREMFFKIHSDVIRYSKNYTIPA